jgi:hypothetical protein
MEKIHFLEQLGRIKKLFGDQHYNEEKIGLIFHRLQFMTNDNFKSTVDEIILNCRFNPAIDDFLKYHDEIRRSKKNKEINSPAITISENRPGSIFSDEEIKMFFATITKAITGDIPMSHIHNLGDYINTRLDYAGIKRICPRCSDTGIIMEEKISGSEYVYACTCPIGKTKPEKYPRN